MSDRKISTLAGLERLLKLAAGGVTGMPTVAQLESLYRVSYQLTFVMLQPIHLVCVDRRTRNVYVLTGQDETLEFEIVPNGEVF